MPDIIVIGWGIVWSLIGAVVVLAIITMLGEW